MYSRQEKNFMKDPLTAAARIYVGNLDQSVVEDDLRTLFSSYGKILGISVQRNFGFIQFDSEQSAHAAIQNELGNIFKGKKLNVRGAITGEGGKGNNNLKNIQPSSTTTPLTDNVNIINDEQQQTTTNVKDNTINNKEQQPQQQSVNNTNTNQLYPRRGGGPSGPRNNNNYRDRSPLDHHQQRHHHHFQQQQQRYPFNNKQQHGEGVKKIDCNDCEIIVVAKSLTEYAEYIENKLKMHGITVDLLFPNEDVPIGRVLANIASRGCLYAILVTPQNEQYHSLTLNILYGATEEHRNMPTDDAINLIHKNFECYLRNGGVNGVNNTNNNIILNKLLIKHSDTIQILLNLLTENRLLSSIQYEQLIKYLQERKQLQQQYEQQQQQLTTTTTALNDNSDDNNEQANELQTRILNILNKTNTSQTTSSAVDTDADEVVVVGGTSTATDDNNTVLNDIVTSVISKINNKTTTSSTTPTPPPLLNDPSVQKALDSLLQADLLKNITIQQQQTTINNDKNFDHYGINYSSNIRRF